jgi:hypothetical protein
VARPNIPDPDLEFNNRRQNTVRQNLPDNFDSNNNSNRVQSTMSMKNVTDYDPDSNHWVAFDHIIGTLVAVKKHPIKSIIVFLGVGALPFAVGGLLIGMFRGTAFASKGGFDVIAMSSSLGANVARPVVFGTGQAIEATFVTWSGGQPVATPVDYRRQQQNRQRNRSWAVVPTAYEGR